MTRIYDALRTQIARHPSGVTGEQLRALLPHLSKNAHRLGLLDLCAFGAVRRAADGRYLIPRV